MRSKSILLLALALGCGLVASIGISQLMEHRGPSADEGDMQPIFVALTDIPANEVLSPQVLKLEEWPKKMVPVGALTKLEEVDGKRAKVKLYTGEPILQAKLLGPDDQVGAANLIPDGYRVAHVRVDASAGSSNLILPGDRVDVLVFRNNNDINSIAAKIVLQDIKVFAVDTQTEPDYNRAKDNQNQPVSAKTIALLVTAQQAVILHAASEMGGALRLVLRNPEDKDHTNIPGATIADIFGNPDVATDRDAEKTGKEEGDKPAPEKTTKEPEAPPLPPPVPTTARVGQPFKMVVMYGSELMEVEFPGDGGLPVSQKKDPMSPSGGSSSPFPESQLTGGGAGTGEPAAPDDGPDDSQDPPTP